MGVLDLLFPVKCPLCGAVLQKGQRGVCEPCRHKLPLVTEPCCKHCGKPVASVESELCMDCSRRGSVLEQGTALWVYTDGMKRAISDFKYEGCLADGDFYAEELLVHRGGRLRSWGLERIIPVPLHWRKRWFRGFNQAAYVAGIIGRELGVPMLEDALVRTRHTRPQKGLDDRGRQDNLKDAFALNPSYAAEIDQCQRVLLLDDIYTTGATLEACGKVLRNAGVGKVYFACLCIGRDY